MIAYFFPPDGSAGVYRPLRFVRQLPTLGWQTSVVALDADTYVRYDPSLLDLIPKDTQVVRVPSGDWWQAVQARRGRSIQRRLAVAPSHVGARIRDAEQAPIRSFFREMVRRAEAWSYHPDMAMCWIRPAVEAAVRLAERQKPDVIWATAGPLSSLIVAQRAAARCGVPYVLDFRDAWTITQNDFEDRRPGWAKRADRRTLYRLFQGAQAVIFRYHAEAECYFQLYRPALDASRIHIIPNGYEGAIEKFEAAEGERCTVLYSGTLSSYRYDTLLTALHDFKRSDPRRARQLRLLFVGEESDLLESTAVALGVSDIIECVPPVSNAAVGSLQRQAHALLVLGRPPTMKGYELFAGAKLFGYLKAGRPIVGVLPLDETRRVLERVGVSTIADSNTGSEIVALFRRLVDAWSEGTLAALVPDRARCEAYSAESQTAALVRALESRPAADPFVPNVVEIPPSLRQDIDAMAWADAAIGLRS